MADLGAFPRHRVRFGPQISKEERMFGIRYSQGATPDAGRGKPDSFLHKIKKNFCVSLRIEKKGTKRYIQMCYYGTVKKSEAKGFALFISK